MPNDKPYDDPPYYCYVLHQPGNVQEDLTELVNKAKEGSVAANIRKRDSVIAGGPDPNVVEISVMCSAAHENTFRVKK